MDDHLGQSNWNNGTTNVDWTNSPSNDALFNDAIGGTVNISGTVQPTSVTVGTNDGNWIFNGTGLISGSTGLTKNGAGSLTVSNANTYTGITTLNGGTLVATSAHALGGAMAALQLNGGTLDLQGTSTAYNTTVGGSTTILSDNTSAGAGVTRTLGTLSIGASTLTAAAGAYATGTTAGVTFGATTLNGAATFSIGTGTTLTLGAVTNNGNTATITGAGKFAQTAGWGGASGGITFDSNFTGTAYLNRSNTFTGSVTIKQWHGPGR